MPTQRLSMRRIREVLRLRHQGLTERVIARMLGASNGVVPDDTGWSAPAVHRQLPMRPSDSVYGLVRPARGRGAVPLEHKEVPHSLSA